MIESVNRVRLVLAVRVGIDLQASNGLFEEPAVALDGSFEGEMLRFIQPNKQLRSDCHLIFLDGSSPAPDHLAVQNDKVSKEYIVTLSYLSLEGWVQRSAAILISNQVFIVVWQQMNYRRFKLLDLLKCSKPVSVAVDNFLVEFRTNDFKASLRIGYC